jgi:hypothetical protein
MAALVRMAATTAAGDVNKGREKQDNLNAIDAANAYIDKLIAQMKPLDLSGAPKLLSDGDIQAERQSVYDSNYQLQTKDLAGQQTHDLEAQKQELANRGIPYNPGSDPNDTGDVNNVYARSINQVNTRYDNARTAAAAAANSAADSSLSTFVNANKTQNDQYVGNQKDLFNSQLDQLAGGAGALNALMSQYGIDAQTAASILQAKTNTRIAQINNQRSGGGGNNGGSNNGGGGFNVPGTGGTVT